MEHISEAKIWEKNKVNRRRRRMIGPDGWSGGLGDDVVSWEDGENRKPLGYYENVFKSQVEKGAFEVVEPGVTRIIDPDDPLQKEITFRHITVFSPLTSRGELYAGIGVDNLVAILMAMDHFNNRISKIVPEIADLDHCNIRFTWEVADTERSSMTTARYMLNEVVPRGLPQASTLDALYYPTAVMGAYRSAVSAHLAIITGLYNITQISFGSASDQLDDKGRYPFFGRTIVGVGGIAIASTDFFYDVLGATHVFCIYVRDVFGIDFYNAFDKRASELGIVTASASLDAECAVDCLEADIDKALDALQASGFKYVYAILSTEQYLSITPKAYERGLAGPGTGFWLFDDTFVPEPEYPDSPRSKASHGSAVLKFAEDALLAAVPEYQQDWDQYMRTNTTLSILNEKFPPELRPLLQFYYEIPESPWSTLWAYDAFMAIALAACKAESDFGPTFSRTEFHDSFLANDFKGATNRVQFDPRTGSRSSDTMTFHIGNYRNDGPLDEDGKVTLTSYDTHEYVFDPTGRGAKWQRIPGEQFRFADNTTNIPPDLPPSEGQVLEIEVWATTLALIFVVVIVSSVLGFGIWMQRHKAALPISAAQPFFIWMLGIGLILMASSLIPNALLPYVPNPNVACQMVPWFLSVGFCVSFAALFSKLMRVAQLFQSSQFFQRVNVKPQDVLKSFLVLLSLNLLILVSWSVVSPLTYQLESLDDYDEYGRPVSSYYTCNSSKAPYFRFALGILDICAVAMTAFQAYRSRRVNIRYNESSHIFLALILSSQSFLIGIPGVVAAEGNPSVQFFSVSLAVTWGCLGLLLPILFPKFSQLREWEEETVAKEQAREERIRKSNSSFQSMRRWNDGLSGKDANEGKAPIPSTLRGSLKWSDDSEASSLTRLSAVDSSCAPVRTASRVSFASVDETGRVTSLLMIPEEDLAMEGSSSRLLLRVDESKSLHS